MSRINKYTLLKYFDTIAIGVFCIIFYSYVLYFLKTDINTHIEQVVRINKGWTKYPPNFLFYFIINLLSGFNNIKVLYPVTVGVLSTATVLKYIISKKIIISYNSLELNNIITNKSLMFWVFTIGLFFCFAIPDPFSIYVLKKIYLTKFVPNVWHNSTVIFLFPFAILLFWKQLKLFDFSSKANIKNLAIINLLVLINLFIKPSFIFAYAPVAFLYMLANIQNKISWKDFILRLSPFIVITIVIAFQYYLIYVKQDGSFFNEKSSIIFTTPFKMATHYMPYQFIPISIILSYLLPIAVMLLYKEIRSYKPFIFALFLTLFAIAISAFVMESGPRSTHGNFLWQIIICSYLLFHTTITFLVPKFLHHKVRSKKDNLMLFLFLIHVGSGMLYIIKIIATHSYY
jgi:hypothetical protein